MMPIKISYNQTKDPKKIKKKGVVPVIITDKKDVEIIVDSRGQRVMHFGVGKKGNINRRTFITLSRRIITVAKTHKIKKITFVFSDFLFPKLKNISEAEIATLLTENFEMANFEFVKFKSKPKEGWNFVDEVIVCGNVDSVTKSGFKKGLLIGEEVNKCRVLANTPGGDMTPVLLANEAKSACRGSRVRVKILGKSEMKKLKMGALLGVAQGSVEEPKFIILEYKGGKKSEKPIVLVGKGVTFDTGGLNLKPSSGILEMHMDMSGGAAVIHSVVLASKLKLKKNVIGLIPAVENMPSGSSYRPGDILRSMSGKTIEVLNTDAEGRVILADALTYAKKYKPRLVVDVATLTGAAVVALGQRASATFSKDEKLLELLSQLGEESGDYVWPLPLWNEYEEDIKGNFADVANISTGTGNSSGGATNGAMFLYQFVKNSSAPSGQAYPWVHIDMAPRMTAVAGEYLAKGAAGAPVRLLVKLLEKY